MPLKERQVVINLFICLSVHPLGKSNRPCVMSSNSPFHHFREHQRFVYLSANRQSLLTAPAGLCALCRVLVLYRVWKPFLQTRKLVEYQVCQSIRTLHNCLFLWKAVNYFMSLFVQCARNSDHLWVWGWGLNDGC